MMKYLPFFCLLFLFSCDKEETETLRTSSLQAPVITGYEFRNNNGMLLMHAGEPNIRTSVEKNGEKYNMSTYPNPISTEASVQLFTTKTPEKVSAWVVAAQQDQSLNSYNFMQANVPVIGGLPLIKIEFQEGFNQNYFKLDSLTFPAGAYRIYVQIDDVLLWDNLLKTN